MSYVKLEMYIPCEPRGPWDRLQEALVKAFGGCTYSVGIGVWVNPKGYRCTEQVFIVVVHVPDTLDTQLTVEHLARTYMREARQECVLYSINGVATFINKEDV